MSKVRISVEWSFGEVIMYFSNLDFKRNLKLRLSPIASNYTTATLLSNIRICDKGSSKASKYFTARHPHSKTTSLFLPRVESPPSSLATSALKEQLLFCKLGYECPHDFHIEARGFRVVQPLQPLSLSLFFSSSNRSFSNCSLSPERVSSFSSLSFWKFTIPPMIFAMSVASAVVFLGFLGAGSAPPPPPLLPPRH